MKYLLLLLLFSDLLFARTHLIWDTNRDHSSLRFEVEYLSFSKIEGSFSKFWGRIYFEEDGELPRSIEFSIDPASVQTGSRIRDGHLRSDDFFAVNKYPTIRFKSKSILAGKPHEFLVKGHLEVKELSIPHEILINLSPLVKDTWNYQNRFVSFKTNLLRSKLGLDWNRSLKGNKLLVGDLVLVFASLQVQPLNKLTPASKHMSPDPIEISKKTMALKQGGFIEELETKEIETIKVHDQAKMIKAGPLLIEKKKKNYPFLLALIILIQLSFFGVLKVFSFLKKTKTPRKLQGLSLFFLSLTGLWAAFYLATY